MLERQRTGISWSVAFVLLLAVLITMVRWWYLVRALGIDFSLPDAMRIGFLGYLFNLAPTGIVGGDLLKAWMLAREKPGNRAKALASVMVDRIVGLYVLFLVAAAGVFFTGFWDIADYRPSDLLGSAHRHRRFHGGNCDGLASRVPGRAAGRGMTRIPKIGGAIESLLDAIQIYRSKRLVLFLTSLDDDSRSRFLAFSLYLVAMGLGFRTGVLCATISPSIRSAASPDDSAARRAGRSGHRLLLPDGLVHCRKQAGQRNPRPQ